MAVGTLECWKKRLKKVLFSLYPPPCRAIKRRTFFCGFPRYEYLFKRQGSHNKLNNLKNSLTTAVFDYQGIVHWTQFKQSLKTLATNCWYFYLLLFIIWYWLWNVISILCNLVVIYPFDIWTSINVNFLQLIFMYNHSICV